MERYEYEPVLTQEDWIEIYYALETKKVPIEEGRYAGETGGVL